MNYFSSLAVSIIIALLLSGCGGKNRNNKSSGLKNYSDTVTRFLFAGKLGKETALYEYDIAADKYFPLKNRGRGKIVDIQANPSRTYIYVITAAKEGHGGVFPFFQKAQLHLLNGRTFAPIKTISIGDGIQLVGGCDSDSTFGITINKIQSNMYSHIAQNKIVFSQDGSRLKEETRMYDFSKEGYPPLPKPKLQLLSNNEKYSITPNEKNALFLHGGVENPKLLAKESKQKMNAIRWTNDESAVVFSTIDVSRNNATLQTAKPQTSTLYIFSLTENVMLKTIEGSGFKHFDIIGNFVIYDDGFGEESRVHIYDLQKKNETRIISIAAGCGLTNIPELPQYGL